MNERSQAVFDALRSEDWEKLLEELSALQVRYIFHNSDSRIIDNFPAYPYVYPGLMYSSKDQIPAIQDQHSYAQLLAALPLKKIYEKGLYAVYEVQYENPPRFEEGYVSPPEEKRFFTGGRYVSIATVLVLFTLSMVVLGHKKYGKK
jgi:hypothetical protein